MPITDDDNAQLEVIRSIMRTVEDGNNVGQALAYFSRYIRYNLERAGDNDLLNAVCAICGDAHIREFVHIMREFVNVRDIHEPVFFRIYQQAEFGDSPYGPGRICTNKDYILSELQSYTLNTRQGLMDGRLPGYYFDRMQSVFSDTTMHSREDRYRCVFTGREIENLRDIYYAQFNEQAQNSVSNDFSGQDMDWFTVIESDNPTKVNPGSNGSFIRGAAGYYKMVNRRKRRIDMSD